ncbi:MAG: transposase [Caldilineaceae bacterium SB0675_bin_29]|uniref:Transposase n=1 Tax=Caldilineaceae bacterium SB0675_bin_29 TaxID=2605266 RepID=A0A6B1G5B1_9CHLR|nr:transposase [Caldilineaceae bacterium SB0675_bin_29]
MSTRQAQEVSKRRKQLIEPVFGIIKEQQGARRFLLRGLVNVAAEWILLATAFNLRILWRIWRSGAVGFLHCSPASQPIP